LTAHVHHHWLHLAALGWLVFVAYWFLSALKLKAVKRREPSAERLVYIACMIVAYVLLFNDGLSNARWLGERFMPFSAQLGALGVAITYVGVGFAIWARWHLGQNWSATVTLKEGHELIRSGPYAHIRHPIYTGMLLALAGTALALGEYRGLLSLVIATASFTTKARKEERYLVQEFGDRFQEHFRKTGMFLPKLS
jgi:protein-S-isoprenylcysteine O-methyltransferase Ste14